MSVQKQTILVADDESHVTYMLAQKLSRAGANVIVACNGAEALQLAMERQPKLIITDFQMPKMSGYDMARRLREEPITADVPLIMLTARGHRLLPSDLASTNIRYVIAKPFSIRELLVKVAEFIDFDTTSGAAAA